MTDHRYIFSNLVVFHLALNRDWCNFDFTSICFFHLNSTFKATLSTLVKKFAYMCGFNLIYCLLFIMWWIYIFITFIFVILWWIFFSHLSILTGLIRRDVERVESYSFSGSSSWLWTCHIDHKKSCHQQKVFRNFFSKLDSFFFF